MIEMDLDKWKLVGLDVLHYPNESMIEGELLLQSDYNVFRRGFKVWFSSDLKHIIKPIGKKH
jgi:hypothetical protein